ncbi:MAG: AAA family ATPase [Prevotella sp.]|nr:AAA family ATPase [Prevotella sp.]
MNETSNNLPDMLTGEELEEQERQAREAEVRQYLLDATQNYPEPFYMLEYKGVPFSTLGGIQALSGQKKNGKTFVLAQLMAAILSNGSQRTQAFLNGLQVPERTLQYLRDKYKNPKYLPSVLYVDTEMEKLNSAKVLRRVHWLCDWQMDVPNERFHVLWLRGVTDAKDSEGKVAERAYAKRYRLIRMAIEMLHPDAVFIDGIRDIIGDFNDNKESAQLVGELMALAETRGICIWNTLHMNPRPGNDDESKMRGHLGTELGNKITDTLVSIKSKTADGVTFTVKQNDARGKDMEDWKFEVTDAAGALGVPRIFGGGEYVDDEQQKRKREADEYFKLYPWTSIGATYTDLEKFLRSKGVTSGRKISDLFNIASEAGIIYKSDKRKYHYAGMNGSIPNDKSEDLPFSKPSSDENAPF